MGLLRRKGIWSKTLPIYGKHESRAVATPNRDVLKEVEEEEEDIKDNQ